MVIVEVDFQEEVIEEVLEIEENLIRFREIKDYFKENFKNRSPLFCLLLKGF